ncbi:hypothetical protein FE257_004619 [Aspergillus nanangensis]|uniref:Methylitaconate delta2-delta3-isomerase n=1 Tax=Aspergillus nanangensis TaxID=2582783 RepID=A0AAD4CYC8_ASPNN|nr:hypothetical protein FE257_004619 [Aspergillus nanangensis]
MVGQLHPTPIPRKRIPAVWMRAGTSKGLFLRKEHLPQSQLEWGPMLLSIMGSRLGDPRQIDGVGGATSTTSKVALVAKSTKPGVDVEYTFVQVSTTEAKIDVSGNCGNMASGVGPFALDEGIVTACAGETEVDIRVLNTNTNRILVETVAVAEDGTFEENGDYAIAGVKGTGSPIKVRFLSPAGSMTGQLFPTGKRTEEISVCGGSGSISEPLVVRATLLDCANPFVLVDDTSLPAWYHERGPDDRLSLELIEQIRRESSVRFGLTSSIDKAAAIRGTPKIAVVSRLPTSESEDGTEAAVLHVTAYSMGNVHPSLPLTGAVCIGMSLSVPGTVSSEAYMRDIKGDRPLLSSSGSTGGCIRYQGIGSGGQQKRWRIRHRTGEIEAEVSLAADDSEVVESVAVFRTARRLFEGSVLFH